MITSYKLFEKIQIEEHLKKRGIDPEKTRVIIDKESEDVFFFLYNLSGQMVGYQKYNPNYPKTGQNNVSDPRMVKYYNYVTEEERGRMIAVWGLETLKMNDKYFFIVEGIFDAARIHQAGHPAIATLCNNPTEQTKEWLRTLPQMKIVIYDNDGNKDSLKLKTCGDHSFTVESGKDMNDLSVEEAKSFCDKIINDLFV